MAVNVDVILTPAEIALLAQRDLSETTCVVFDVLRATSTFVTALARGATSIHPVAGIMEAVALRSVDTAALLAGERGGHRIRGEDAGGVEFDLGNSPREFTADRVQGRRIISTTTNGTLALRACAKAKRVYAGAFVNLSVTAGHVTRSQPAKVLLVCAGTGDEPALEDVLAAGACCARLTELDGDCLLGDASVIAERLFAQARGDLVRKVADARNARRLLAIPELRDDVEFCSRLDAIPEVVIMNAAGQLLKATSPGSS